MPSREESEPDAQGAAEDQFRLNAPQISLPKGGGAIRGIGEKFKTNPVTGTGSLSVPLAISPGRGGFGPQLALSYDSGAGNGPFGLGWSLQLPSITRRTDKGLPQYLDRDESDVFILAGSEDLVPVFKKSGDDWALEDGTHVYREDPAALDGKNYQVRRYQSRIEGAFVRVERWSNVRDIGDVFWRTITTENIASWYGRTEDSRIADPADASRIFSWLICETCDDKGNVVAYEYAREDDTNVDQTQANERHRLRTANRYPRRITYGNTPSRLSADFAAGVTWHFEILFDYGEPGYREDEPDADGNVYAYLPTQPAQAIDWPVRRDPVSAHRAGFEIRTYRLCRRVLMFHRFDDLLGAEPQLVRATQIEYDPNPIATRLRSITHCGYVPAGTDGTDRRYFTRTFPPLNLEYSEAVIDAELRAVDAASLDNLPVGLDGNSYRWVDLDGDGLPGILTEQADAWFYKRNLAPITLEQDAEGRERARAQFAPVELLARKPNVVLAGQAQFMDLAGDGQPDVVVFDAASPGFYENDGAGRWESFRPFAATLNRNVRDPNLRFVDLDGDGLADVLVTEDEAFTWHPSLGEEGYGPARRVPKPRDEEAGPALVFADGAESIYLADMSGDGLTDLVRVRNGEVCYWPNQGYGTFGAKVTMDHSPWLDAPERFDRRRVRLADLDGSGLVDLVYLHGDGVRLYFNQSGNSWSDAQPLRDSPRVDDISSVAVVDLLGNGTACLVWSSPLPGDARRPMQYVDLFGGGKPHLLTGFTNNLGATTTIEYAPSTRFYLQDRLAGRPWATRLPFPVHCVSRVSVHDRWRNTTFSTTYSYHHGYFDGEDREFRGFGRVEQIDAEEYGRFSAGNTASPYIADDWTLYQPPVKTITWYHTGVFVDEARVLSLYAHEYFPAAFTAQYPARGAALAGFAENALPAPDVADLDLTADEWREALRACKGRPLRQEIYELDVDDLRRGVHSPTRLFSTGYHNCRIRRLQPRFTNRHAVMLTTESEAVTYHYELDLRQPGTPDPRIGHTLNLNVDHFGHVLQAITVVYPRLTAFADATLAPDDQQRIRDVQRVRHTTYTESRYTDADIDDAAHYRPRLLCEVQTYELTGVEPGGLHFSMDELREYRLSERYQTAGVAVDPLGYEQTADQTTPQKRLLEHVRTLYYDDADDHVAPAAALAFAQHGPRGLKFEDYKLALTDDLLNAVFQTRDAVGTVTDDKLALEVDAGRDARDLLNDPQRSGYVRRTQAAPPTVQYWMRSGIASYANTATSRFFQPARYTDPFGNPTDLTYDLDDLFIASSTDALGNVTSVEAYDFRVLAPAHLKDANANVIAVAFDARGLPVAQAVMGKVTGALAESRDTVAGATLTQLNPKIADIRDFFTAAAFDGRTARRWLATATTRFVYHLGEALDARGHLAWGTSAPGACSIARERHEVDAPNVDTADETRWIPVQVSFAYSDGASHVLLKKLQAEPDPLDPRAKPPLRWITSGKTVLNNKGKAVKRYEAYFSDTHGLDAVEAQTEVGVTPILYYDSAGRLVRTEMPDGTLKRVDYTPWRLASYDANDTVLESQWYAGRGAPLATAAEPADADRQAAWLATLHSNTPAEIHFDTLGRDVIVIEHNRVEDAGGTFSHGGKQYKDEKHSTFTRLDAEGKPLSIRDPRGNLVLQYVRDRVAGYDVAGNLLFQRGMDGGDRWTLLDAAGKSLVSWDRNNRGTNTASEDRVFFVTYDALHRTVGQWLRIDGGAPQMFERVDYRDARNADGSANAQLAADQAANLLGQAVRHYDAAGRVETIARDFNGNVLEVRRRLNNRPTQSLIDWQANPQGSLEAETFTRTTRFDALDRVVTRYQWHTGVGARVAVYQPAYGERGLITSHAVRVGATKTAAGADEAGSTLAQAIAEIRYNARGQKEYVALGNGTLTQYDFDRDTFRLAQLRTTRPADGADFPARHSNLRDNGIVQQLSYTYDPTGNVTAIVDEAYEPVFFRNQQVQARATYAYDPLYRLTSATGRENDALRGAPGRDEGSPVPGAFPRNDPNALRTYTQTFAYDTAGNLERLHHEAGAGTWTRRFHCADDSNRLTETWDTDDDWNVVDPTLITSYGYDTHGNALNLVQAAPRFDLRWDRRDMIERISLGGGGTAYYQYDANRQRTRKRIERAGIVEERIYFDDYELYRRYQAANPAVSVDEIASLHLFDQKQRVLLVDDVVKTTRRHDNGTAYATGPIFRYQYSNHLGSACLELDDQAAIISYEESHPYGTSAYRALAQGTEAPATRYRYTGMERDEESGLSYHGARYYLSWLARWASADTAGLVDGPNLYRYARDNPVMWVDPTGHDAVAGAALALTRTTIGFFPGEYGAGLLAADAEAGSAGMGAVEGGMGADAAGPFGMFGVAVIVLSILTTQRFMRRSASLVQYGNPSGASTKDLFFPELVDINTMKLERWKHIQIANPLPKPKLKPQQMAEPKPDPKTGPQSRPKEEPPKPTLRGRVYVTYFKFNVKTGMFYAGRTSMEADLNGNIVQQAIAAMESRDARHHVDENEEPNDPGFLPAQIDQISVGYAANYNYRYRDPGYWAIRGREQQLIDHFGMQRLEEVGQSGHFTGGAHSDTDPLPPLTENTVRGVARDNPLGVFFNDAANLYFQTNERYTGD